MQTDFEYPHIFVDIYQFTASFVIFCVLADYIEWIDIYS